MQGPAVLRPVLFVLATSQSPGLPETLATAYHPGMCLLALPVIVCKKFEKRLAFNPTLLYNGASLRRQQKCSIEGGEETVETDMTVGSPYRVILGFTMPIFIGNIFQQLYNMADAVIVGKFVGPNALAAVGSCGTLMFLILGFLQGLTAGFTVITAQHFGAGNMKAMRQSVGSAYILSAVVSVLMTALSMSMMKQILHWMNTPPEIYREAYGYIMVICAGIVAQVLYNLLASILRALGNSKVLCLSSSFTWGRPGRPGPRSSPRGCPALPAWSTFLRQCRTFICAGRICACTPACPPGR